MIECLHSDNVWLSLLWQMTDVSMCGCKLWSTVCPFLLLLAWKAVSLCNHQHWGWPAICSLQKLNLQFSGMMLVKLCLLKKYFMITSVELHSLSWGIFKWLAEIGCRGAYFPVGKKHVDPLEEKGETIQCKYVSKVRSWLVIYSWHRMGGLDILVHYYRHVHLMCA